MAKKKPSQPIDPTNIIGEILGLPAALMRNPVNAGNICPYTDGECAKRGHLVSCPLPVCSIYKRGKISVPKTINDLVAICPKRLFEPDLKADIIKHCWPGEKPLNVHCVHEVKMGNFGTVDLVLADLDSTEKNVREFVSAELQAVDTTGSYMEAYEAVLHNQLLETRPQWGFNWSNVYKRYVMQLVNKGFHHHHWHTTIVSVLQEPVFACLERYAQFSHLDATDQNVNIIFLVYKFTEPDDGSDALAKLELSRVVRTSHNSLMLGPLYRTPPEKKVFCAKILARLPGN